jgi:tartrate-resistant acid phosphatase type 5
MSDRHFEPYVYLADVTERSVILAWGGFYFRTPDGAASGQWELVDDEQLPDGRTETIGVRSEPFGDARVELLDPEGAVVATQRTTEANHVRFGDLEPGCAYRYRIEVDGRTWTDGPTWDWVPADPDSGRPGELVESGRRYDCRFRTFPDPATPSAVRFAVIGDFGVGVSGLAPEGLNQWTVARTLDRLASDGDIDLVLTTGDNVYHDSGDDLKGTGDEDDDWFFTYYQPYRYVISRFPVFPAVGNHDSSDTELSDDRAQLEDNMFLAERFERDHDDVVTSIDPGLFYRFRFGRDVEFVCLDTTQADELDEEHFFAHPRHRAWLGEAFPDTGADAGGAHQWRIPFSHHPVFCAGPSHDNHPAMLEHLVPLFERSGTRLVLAGHEHNFQHAERHGIHYVVSGASGRRRAERPERFEDAHVRAWSAAPHLLRVRIDGSRCDVDVLGGLAAGEDRPAEIRAEDATGAAVAAGFTIDADR